jgi:transposase
MTATKDMARPYSDDLREKFLAAYEAGNVSLAKLAATFQVSRCWAENLWRTKRETGHFGRPPAKPRGFPSRLTPAIRERLAIQIGQRPDATVNELREWLQKEEAIAISQQRLSAIILEMGIGVKKKLARQRAG